MDTPIQDNIAKDLGISHLSKEDIQACLKYAARSLKNEIYLEL